MITFCISCMCGFLGGVLVWNDIEKRIAKIEREG